MVYLILAFCSSAMVSVLMRFSHRRVGRSLGMLAANYAVCTALACLEAGFGSAGLNGPALWMGALNGFFYLAGFVMLQRSIGRSGVVLSATFMKLGLLVTLVISTVFFGERPGGAQVTGFVLAVAAIVLMGGPSGEGRFHPGLLLLPLVGGMCDGMSKVYEELGNPAFSGQFLFDTFFTALVLCFALAAWKKQLPGKWEWCFGALIGVPNFYASRFLLSSLATVPGVIAYPAYAVAGILLVTLAGVFLFRERLTKGQWVAMVLILAALVLLNL